MDMSSVDLRYESRKEWGCSKDVKFQDLIDAAHAKGMKIILDVVLQHTSNFGEEHLNKLFTRDQRISNQATPAGSLIPNYDKLSQGYFNQTGEAQYAERFKYFKNPQYDSHNYYHHYGTGWNWDYPNRWWGQIAGDCVDLNTENETVANYVVECYGKFIEMGVDGFRIDTTGHIAPLTFNKYFVPKFMEIAKKAEGKRLNKCPFYMFGECCQRFQGSVVYRNQANLSSYFYTWKSSDALMNAFDGSQTFWDSQNLPEGHDTPVGPMAVCEQDTEDKPRSNNAWLQNGEWHEPDYSQSSGLNVIDFPVHYGFNSVSNIMGLFKQDNYYNDATYNVVYVDSHDYCPGPNDGTRFNGGTSQWAENLTWMFTFRGIPCIYYGSEVEFKKGKPIDVGGTNNKTPRSESGRAYFGEYLKGDVAASDFGVYTASGNVAKTLDADLAQHIRRLNMIRAAVPALRKGQYTFDGCSASGGWAFKRAYKNESYALVSVNGGATFSNVPAGTYVDVVTGQSYTASNGSITVSAPQGKGQLRVLVKDWKGGKIGEDGKFIYASSAVAHGGSVEFEDPGTTEYYTADDVVGCPEMKLNPAGGNFRTETLTVTASLNSVATSGWFQVGNQAKVNMSAGESKQFTIGEGMNYGESITVSWGAKDNSGEYTGSATYKKVDPNAGATVYVTGKNGVDISGTNLYVWNNSGKLNGDWPGKALTSTIELGGRTFYYETFDTPDTYNIIFNRNGAQTSDIKGLQGDVYYEYDGASTAVVTQVEVGPKAPVIRANPASGTSFHDPISVTLSVSGAENVYYTLDGSTASASSTKYTGPITISTTTTINAYASNDAGETRTSFFYTYQDEPVVEEVHAYFDNLESNWGKVYVYSWDDEHMKSDAFSGSWPGTELTETVTYNNQKLYHFHFSPKSALSNPMIIFNNANGDQTNNFVLVNNGIYNKNGKIGDYSVNSSVDIETIFGLRISIEGGKLVIYSDSVCEVPVVKVDGTMRMISVNEGYNYYELPRGFYIVANTKVAL